MHVIVSWLHGVMSVCVLIANLYMSLVGETMLCVTLSLEVFDHPLPFMGTSHNVYVLAVFLSSLSLSLNLVFFAFRVSYQKRSLL